MKAATRILTTVLLLGLATFANAQSTITVSPGGISMRGTAGGTATQNFTVSNGLPSTYRFEVEVMDVVVTNGQRNLVPAGVTAGSAAALAVVPPEPLFLAPGAHGVVPVTFVIPKQTDIRAVAVFFRGRPAAGTKSNIHLNLGAVVDFSLSDQTQLDGKDLLVALQTPTTNLRISEELANVGREPFIARGVAAILEEPGKLVGKMNFDQKRMLPSERNTLHAEYPGTLRPGKYRIVCSFEYAGKTMTRTTSVSIQ
ncbi:MAG TPA: hypothetical protein VF135_07790 [Terriglobales bacterium]